MRVDGRATDRWTCWLKTRLAIQLSLVENVNRFVVPVVLPKIEEQAERQKRPNSLFWKRGLDGLTSYAVCWMELYFF